MNPDLTPSIGIALPCQALIPMLDITLPTSLIDHPIAISVGLLLGGTIIIRGLAIRARLNIDTVRWLPLLIMTAAIVKSVDQINSCRIIKTTSK